MLRAAHAARENGASPCVGVLAAHERPDTEALALGLPRVRPRGVFHREQTLQEFDLDAGLAWGAGQVQALLLIDDLAHGNVPGSRHAKRWQDVQELLDAGIDVWTTLGVEHLEGLSDITERITGVHVRETVPDRIFDEADEVAVVDLPVDELLKRWQEGGAHQPSWCSSPKSGDSSSKSKLLALRELTLRRAAERADAEMQAYRLSSALAPAWSTHESPLACIGPGPEAEKIVRSCARLASQLRLPWHAVHVETPEREQLNDAQRARIANVLRLAHELGAVTATIADIDVPQALARYAHAHNLSRLVVGRGMAGWRPFLRSFWRRRMPDRLAACSANLDILLVSPPAVRRRVIGGASPEDPAASARTGRTTNWKGYGAALSVCGLAALAAASLRETLELTNIMVLFLLAVVGIALRFGRGPAAAASIVGTGLFDFFFVPPIYSFAVSDVQYAMTFAVMLCVGLVIGQLTAVLRVQARAATERERRVRSLYLMTRDLSGALLPEQVAEIARRFLLTEFGARSALLAADASNQLRTLPGATLAADEGVAQWAFEHGQPAGSGTQTLPSTKCTVLPLIAPMRTRGVLAVQPLGPEHLGPEQRRLLDTCASLLAISLERLHYVAVAQSSSLQIESERLRSSLLSAVSHDLRTPLASLVGLAETLQMSSPQLSLQQQEIALSMRQGALRMNALVNNLLDMARLEAGAVRINLQWQPLEEVLGGARTACEGALSGRPVHALLQPDLPLLHLDAVLMERVFCNLLENAVKYTPPLSAIRIAAQVDEGFVRITVDDDGPGLPAGREEAIFEKFERGQPESALPGVGLGLAVSRAIVHAHGGSIRGETRNAAGARFTILLPLGQPPSDDGTLNGCLSAQAGATSQGATAHE